MARLQHVGCWKIVLENAAGTCTITIFLSYGMDLNVSKYVCESKIMHGCSVASKWEKIYCSEF